MYITAGRQHKSRWCIMAFHKLANSLFHASCIRCIKTLLILWWARIRIPLIMLFL